MAVYNRTTLAHQFCLLLSPDSLYAKAALDLAIKNKLEKNQEKKEVNLKYYREPRHYSLAGQPHWPTKAFFNVIGIKWESAKEYAITGEPTTQTAKLIEESIASFREEVKREFGEDYPLLKNTVPIQESDLRILTAIDGSSDIANIGEDAVWNIKIKLGLSKAQAYLAFDVFRNMISKPNCGHAMEKGVCNRILKASKGVYFIVGPSLNGESSSLRTFTLRVMHDAPEKQPNKKKPLKCIRAKINMPNIHKDKYPQWYQYRGYLIPTNHDHCWSFEMNQAPYSAVHEEKVFRNERKALIDPDWEKEEPVITNNEKPLNYSDDVHLQLNHPQRDRIVSGLLSSLSQRPEPNMESNSRVPYGCVVFSRNIYDGDYSKKEKWFMKHGAKSFENFEQAIGFYKKHLHRPQEKDALTLIEDTLLQFDKYRKRAGVELVLTPPTLADIENL